MCWRDIRSSHDVPDSVSCDTELYCQGSPRETTAFRRTWHARYHRHQEGPVAPVWAQGLTMFQPTLQAFVLGTDWVQTRSGCRDNYQGCMQHEERECIIMWLAELHESLSITSLAAGILDYTTVQILWHFSLLHIFIFYPILASCSTHPIPELNPYNVWWEAAEVTVLF